MAGKPLRRWSVGNQKSSFPSSEGGPTCAVYVPAETCGFTHSFCTPAPPPPVLLFCTALELLHLALHSHSFPCEACWMTDQAIVGHSVPHCCLHSPELSIEVDEILSFKARRTSILFLYLYLVEHTASTSEWLLGIKGIWYGHCFALLGSCTIEGMLPNLSENDGSPLPSTVAEKITK